MPKAFIPHSGQGVPTFSEDEIKKFQTRLENGYDLKIDPRYNLWLSGQPESTSCTGDSISETCEKCKYSMAT